MGDGGFDPTIGALNAVLNLRTINQNVISSNIANADTPNYKAKKLEFEGALRDALEARRDAAHPKHATDLQVAAEVFDDPNGIESLDGNTVNRMEEMARFKENEIHYNEAVEMLKRKLGMMKYAITEGGGGR